MALLEYDLEFGLPQLISVAIVTTILAFVGHAFYRLYIDPLSIYPGSFLSVTSSLPLFIARLRGNVIAFVDEQHAKYGPVVRLSPSEISYIEAEAWRDIYGHKVGGRGGFDKDLSFDNGALGGQHNILFANDADHSRQRRVLAHAFSDRAIREQEPLISIYVKRMTDAILNIVKGSKGPAVIDLADWYGFVAFDIICDLAFAEDLGMTKSGEWSEWSAGFFNLVKGAFIGGNINRELPLLKPLSTWLTPSSLIAAGQVHIDESTTRIERRLARQREGEEDIQQRPDIMHHVLKQQSKDESKALSKPEYHALGVTLMGAGTETTATLLAGMSYLLTENPAKLAKLVAEIRDKFSRAEDINMAGLATLPYLHACIEEAMRLYQSVQVGQPRLVPKGGRMIAGKFVPGGTTVYVSHHAAYKSELNFANPLEFAPERWLTDMPEARFANDNRDVFNPFSYGPRNCLGKNLAYNEVRLIMANTLWHFDLHSNAGNEHWLDQKVYGLNTKPSLKLGVSMAPHLSEMKA